jgi:hypothetical protein
MNAQLQDLCWRDKAVVAFICLFGLWQLCQPWFEARRRESAIAAAGNVERMRKVRKRCAYTGAL